MYIGFLAPIATEDLLSTRELSSLESYPKGYEGAPLTSVLINEYIARGNRVLAITTDTRMDGNIPPFIYQSGLLTFIVVPNRTYTFRFNGKRPGRAIDFFWFERQQIAALLRTYQPDVVHAHWAYEFALAALQYTPDALISVHDDPWAVLKYMPTPYRFFRLLLAQYVFWKGRRFTTVSPYMAYAIQKWIKPTIHVIPNPLTVTAQSTNQAKNGRIISIIMNGWDKRKNGESALLAFKKLRNKHPDVILWAMGTAFEPTGQARTFCEENNIADVVFWGKLPHADILKNLTESYLLLHTSLEESFGMVLIEAMYNSVPVIAGQQSGAVPWVVQDGGLLVDVRNTNEIADAMSRLLTDDVLYNKLSQKARENVMARFSIDSVADQYLALYGARQPLPIEETSSQA